MNLETVRNWRRAARTAKEKYVDGGRTSIHVPADDLYDMTNALLALAQHLKEDKEKEENSVQN